MTYLQEAIAMCDQLDERIQQATNLSGEMDEYHSDDYRAMLDVIREGLIRINRRNQIAKDVDNFQEVIRKECKP